MACCRTLFKNWRKVNFKYTYPLTDVSELTVDYASGLTVNLNSSSVSGNTYNFTAYEGKQIEITFTTDTTGTFTITHGSDVLTSVYLTANDTLTQLVTFPYPDDTISTVVFNFDDGNGIDVDVTCYDNRSGTEWVLSDIITDTLIDSDFCDFFNRYYKNWFVNGCSDNLEDDLILCWLTHKDQITAYATAMATYNPTPGETVTKAYGLTHSTNNLSDVYAESITNNDTTYGQRDSTDNEYEYPISGALSTSTPNKGLKSQSLEVTDENTVTRQAHTDSHNRTLESNAHTDTFTTVNNEKPNQIVKNVKDLTTYWLFMAEQFRDCFTLNFGMTW